MHIDYQLHLDCQGWTDHESFHLVKILSQMIALKSIIRGLIAPTEIVCEKN